MSTTVIPRSASPSRAVRSDAALVAAVRAGDDDAFAEIVERYRGPLLGFARKLLGGRHHDAEECVQDGLMRALRSLRAHPEAEIALRPWLHVIVRNACLDRLRRPQRCSDIEDVDRVLADDGPGPATQIDDRERFRHVVDEVAALPARQRRALVLHEIDQRSHSAIGRTLGISPAASKALVCRARRTLGARAARR